MMKKLYALYFLLLATGELFGQSPLSTKTFPLKQFPVSEHFMEKVVPYSASAERSVILSDDFSDTTHWVIATQGQGSWEIVNSTPADVNQYMGSMASTTAANGFALFNGIQYILANTPATQSTTLTYYAPIDLSSYPNVAVQFEQRYRRRYYDSTYLEISVDSLNWVTIPLNSDVLKEGYALQNTELINISSYAGGSDSVYIRFRWTCIYNYPWQAIYVSGYGWGLDDLKIVTAPEHELILKSARYYDANSVNTWGGEIKYTIVHKDQVDELAVAGILINAGQQSEQNVLFDFDVQHLQNGIVHSGADMFDSIPSMVQEVSNSATGYSPPNIQANYQINYNLGYDSLFLDYLSENNNHTESFQVSNYWYGRDDNVFTQKGVADNGYEYFIGNLFEAKESAYFMGVEAAFTAFSDPNQSVCAQIYEVEMTTGDFILIANSCGTNWENFIYEENLSADSTINWVTFCVDAQLIEGHFYVAGIYHLEANKDLFVMGSYSEIAAPYTVFLWSEYDYSWYYMNVVPKIRLADVFFESCYPNVPENSTSFTLLQNQPNPAEESTEIVYYLKEYAEVALEITNLQGQKVFVEEYGKQWAGEHRVTLATDGLSPGVYFYSLTVGGERLTRKMIVQ